MHERQHKNSDQNASDKRSAADKHTNSDRPPFKIQANSGGMKSLSFSRIRGLSLPNSAQSHTQRHTALEFFTYQRTSM
jgi:hypothetical protein